jgi:outer membrane protein
MRLSFLAPSLALGAGLLALAVAPTAGLAQQPAGSQPSAGPTPVLSLEEAIGLARRNNPAYLQSANDRGVADAQVRSAYAAFLPRVDASLSTSYREGRPQFVNGVSFGAQQDLIGSDYALTARMDLSPTVLQGPRLQRANARATDADVESAAQTLRANVAQQYVTVLQRQATVALQESLLVNVKAQLELARARAAVGAGTVLDVKRAEVTVGTQEVALVRARNDAEIEMLRLFQRVGVEQPQGAQLTTRFEVTQPSFTQQEVLDMARRQNPTLSASRARETAAAVGFRNAQGQYVPTLSLYAQAGGQTNQFTGISGSEAVTGAREDALRNNASCQESNIIRQSAGLDTRNCDLIAPSTLSPTQESRIRRQAEAFPFSFERNPFFLSAQLSLPIFNQLQREQRVQEAAAQRNDARYGVRAQELAVTADVTAAYLSLQAALRAHELQTQNAATAREALRLAEERYRVGANTFVDVQQARADFERAETDRINAVYDYHRAFAALEAAVGRPLR